MFRHTVLTIASFACLMSGLGYSQVSQPVAPKPTAETVYFTAHGKTYHTTTQCLALSHSGELFTSSEADAVSHGLKLCRICHRHTRAGRVEAAKPTGVESWAKPVKEQK